MKNFNLIEMAKAMKERKLRHMWRYAAMMALLLTLACGNVWGETDYILGLFNVSDGNVALTKNSFGTNGALVYNGSSLATTTAVSFKTSGGDAVTKGSIYYTTNTLTQANCTTATNAGTTASDGYVRGFQIAVNSTYTLALGDVTATDIYIIGRFAKKQDASNVITIKNSSSETIGNISNNNSTGTNLTPNHFSGTFTGNITIQNTSTNSNDEYRALIYIIASDGGGGGGGGDECSSPSFSTPPTSASYAVGASATNLTATATATNPGTITYKWQKSTNYGSTYSDIDGATNQTYKPSTSTVGITYYRSVASFSGGCSDTNSDPAIVAVKGSNSGTMSGSDYICFKNKTANNTATSATTSNSTALTSLSGQLTGDGKGDKSAMVTASTGQTYSFTVASGYTFDPTYIGFKGSYVGSGAPTQMTFTYELKNSSSETLCSGTFVQATHANTAPLDTIYKGSIDIPPLEAGTYTLKITGSQDKNVANNFRLGNWVTIKGTVASSCSAPTAVYVTQTEGSADMIAGESFTLSAATSTGVEDGASYQWYRGSTEVGTNSPIFTVASCTAADAGTYWCKITNPCSSDAHTTNTVGFGIKVWQVLLYKDSWNAYDLTSTGTKTGEVTRQLTPGTYYIKLTHNNGVDFGVNTGSTISEITATTPSAWTLYNGQNNIKVTVTTAGDYTFGVNYTSADNPTLSVTYPPSTISSCDKIYFCPTVNSIATGSARFSIYFWNATESGWANCYLVSGTDFADDAKYVAYAPATTNGWTKMIVVRDDVYASSFDGIWNQSQDITYNGYNYIVGTGWSDGKFTNNLNSFYSSTTPAMTESEYCVIVGGTTTASTNLPFSAVTYTSSDEAKATVGSTTAVITGVAAGTATITAKVGTCTVGTATVTVYAAPSVALSSSSVTYGASAPTLTPSNFATITGYSSLTTGTATINGSGVISIAGAGTTTFTVTGTDQCGNSVNVTTGTFTVNKADISPSLSYTSTTLTYGGGNSSTPTISGNTGSGTVTYSVSASSPSGCATVNESTGVVTPVSAGAATITATIAATTNYNGGTATTNFTINKATPTKYDFSVDKTTLCGEETATLTLEDSEDGVTYELRSDATHSIADTQKAGTGSALAWTGLGAGNYVVYAVETANYEERQMNSSKITVTTGTATSITTQPTNQEVTVGEEATLTVVAAGTSLTYQWKESATEDGTYSNVASGGTSSSYSVTPAAAGTKWYKCVVTGTCGEVTTAARKIVANAAVTYTVTYVYNGATSGDETESATGASVTLPNPSKTGYTLQGWYTSSGSLAGAATATYNPTSNITLYALWREDACAGGGGGSTTIFKAKIKSSGMSALNSEIQALNTNTSFTTSNYLSELTGGSFTLNISTAGHAKANDDRSVRIANTSAYFVITLSDGTFRAGDIIKASVRNQNGYLQTSSGSYSASTDISITKNNEYTSIITNAMAGKSTLYLKAASGNMDFDSIEIIRPSEVLLYMHVKDGLTNGNMPTDETQQTTSNNLSVITGGTVYAGAGTAGHIKIVNTNEIQINNSTGYLKLVLPKALEEGDVLYFRSTTSQQISITKTASRSTTITTSGYQYPIPKSSTLIGESTIWLWYNSSAVNVKTLAVVRPGGGGECYYVTYNGNGADGGFTKDEASHASGSNVTVKTNSFTKTGYTFTGWNTEAEGTGTPYTASGTISGISGHMTLYAQWIESGSTYGITYHCNDATSGCPDNATGQVALPDPLATPTKTNYSFGGWYTNDALSSEAVAGATLDDDADLYAKWTQTITLKTGTQGSGADKTPTVVWQGTALNGFSAHTADGYTLQGYYTAGSGGVKVLNADGTFAAANVTDYITSSKWSRTGAAPTLFAQWRAAGGASCNTIDHISDFPSSGSTGMTVGNLKVTYSGDKVSRTTATIYSGKTGCNVLKIGGSGTGQYVQGYLGGNEISSLELGVEGENSKAATPYCVAFSASSTFDDESVLSWSALNSQKNTNTSSATSDTLTSITVPSGAKYFRIYRKASFNSIELGAGSSVYVWHIKACTAGASTHTITYANGGGTGTMTSDADIADDGTQILKTNTFTAPTNYSFAGWVADVNVTIGGSTVTAGTLIANGATITNITVDIALTAKWSQSVTLDANTSNHGSGDNGSATAYYNAAALSSITHTTAASGYKLSGYYTADTEGTKVLNSDGTFAGTAVTGYITDGKWTQATSSSPTLYAQYEPAGSLTWNLSVNTDATSLTTSSKASSFTEILNSNMTNATLAGELTYEKSKKSALTGKISTPASYDADDYVYVTFQVASGYKFTPSMIQVPVQPVGNGEHKAVELRLTDTNTHSLVSGSATKCDGTSSGKTTTVTLAGDGTYFTGTVTLKIYVYAHATASATTYNCYRLGTPIEIQGEVEALCATMPSYTSMSYTTTTFAPGADASGSPITIVGGDNINTYQWKYNTVNDRTSGTNCGTGTSLTPLTNEGAATDGTRYYWCEMTNDACGITIKSPAVAITVAAAKSDASVTWTDPESTPNYGGGGYTIKATVDQTGWNGNAADLVITAPAGINIYNVTSGTTSDQKWVQADFDVQTSFDRTTYASNIPFTVSAAATASYNAISNDRNVSYSACTGAGEGSSYNIRMRKTITKDGNYYHSANTDGWISPNIGSSHSTAKAGTTMATYFDTVASSNTQYVWVRTYHANVNKVRIYADFRANDMTVSNVYKHTAYFSADSKYAVDYTAVYNGDEENENTGTAAQGYVDITLDEVMAANDILLVKFNDGKVRPLGAVITEGSAGSLNTYLRWSGGLADGATVAKNTTDAYFTYSASKITENTNTLGTITYSSSNTSVATVDATGKVAMVAAGSTTIKATLAASGCYKKAEISYTLNVTVPECTIAAGTLTLTSGTESKCSSANVTLTLTGFESDASIQWKDGDTNIDNGGNYTIATDVTTRTSTLTTNQPGTYSVMVTSGCSVRSNRITISNKSTEVGAKRIVKNWYIKNGRLTPDIELWTLQNGAHLSSVAWSPVNNATGLTASDFYESDGKVYLKGKEPSSNTSGADIDYTLTLTVVDDCGSTTDMSASGQLIYLHHQQNTDKHVLAFVVSGTDKGGFTEGITAAQTTSVPLYNEIAANFDVLATNIKSTDDEQALKEYYSQFDILCVTDYPNTEDKGVNKKSYVDALGALVDIRPILTMEAWVSKLANWKAKGISGTPQSPTTRQYTMLLQCKDHEIFSGTERTKVGEGDETMYRVSMVDNTQEEYVSLDATYGAGTHEKDKNYQYGKKPALQGFTFTKEMLDDDLLPLGLIDDGSGNDLQVGIERQTEMEARLMVLGINSYAMERLTDDGQTVVVNALKYLMKKNAEDIADCSIYFTGGDEDEDESTRYNWNVDSHWSNGTQPISTQKVRILAKCVIPSGVQVHVTDVLIVPNGPINHGADVAKGSLTIEAGGALIVDGKVEETTAPNYFHPHATSAENLVLKTSSSAQAALIFDNEEAETQATVNLYSLGRRPSSYQYQYFAVPMEVVPVNPVFANETHGGTGIYTYVYEEASSGWTRRKYYDDLFAFEGLGITTKSTGAMEYEMTGNLASTATKEITLTHDGAGLNLVGNSWMAPIQIGALAEDNTDANITKTVYIYCAGRDAEGGAVVSSDDTETAGQWLAVPFEAAEFATWKATGKLSVIPAMQAFEINVSAEATLTLDYDKVVRGSTNDLNAKLRAPGRRMAANEVTMTNIRVADSKTHTDLSLFEGNRFSEAFDNGWEAEYMNGDGRSAKLYAETEAGQMAVAAMYDYEGTVVGFAPGQETEYTFSFMGEDNGYYLNDIKLQNSVRISEGETYTFTYEEGDTENRFYISRTAINAPEVATGMENLDAAAPKVQKIIYNDKLYIIRGGRLYDATGKVVK